MINEELREELSHSYPEALLFDNPSYDNSIIGISHNGRIIYSFEKMIEELCKEDNVEQDEAIDFISYNTERAIPYAGENAPIIMYDLPFL